MSALHNAIRLLAVCQIVTITGCAVVRANVSIPKVPVGSTGQVTDEVLRLKLDGMTFSTQMYNYHETDSRGGYSTYVMEHKGQLKLWLWISFDVKDSNFTFDPGLVTLTADNGEQPRPIAFVGPSAPWESPRSVGMGCGPRVYEFGWSWAKFAITDNDIEHGNPERSIWKESPGTVPLKDSTCFLLTYDTNSDPDRTFVLSVQGVKKAGKPFLIPDITFAKGSISKTFGVP